MDEKLLGRAVEFHGPDFLRQLQLEQQNMPPNIFLHLQRHRPHPPEIDDPQFVMNIRRFVSKKADMLFQPINTQSKSSINLIDDDEDSFAKMPPLETFMGIDPNTCRRHFFASLRVHDLVIGIVTSILDSGLVLQLLCQDEDKNRDIDTLRITAFVPVKEIPKMFPTQNPTEGYQVQDFIRGVVMNVNIETENIVVSLSDRELEARQGTLPHLGLIHEEDFPVQYRRKLHIRGLTFDELLHSIMGFTNPGNVQYLLRSLGQVEESSMMRGLHRLKIPDKEYADSLRKQQSQKMAYKNVAQGIAFFKEGRQTEAMQQLNKALQIDPKNVEALVARGALYANNESYNRAIEDFEEALQINRKHPNALKYMHETLLAKGRGLEDTSDWNDAEDCYKKALDLQPDSHEAKESIKYVQYRKESGKSQKKPYDDKSTSQTYQSTSDTLKKMIKVEQVSRKKKTVEEKPERQRSRKYSSSSSSSSSSSRSSSRSTSRSRSDIHRQSLRQRTRSPKSRSSPKRRSRSPTYKGGKDYPGIKSRRADERIISQDLGSGLHQPKGQNSRSQDEHSTSSEPSQHYSFFKKDERIPFLDTSPQKDDYKEPSDELENVSRPLDDEDDDLYGDSKYEKPDRNTGSVDKKYSSRDNPNHSYQYDIKPGVRVSPSPDRKAVRREIKATKERSVTPTKDEINDRLGLEDISPDVHDEHNRRNDDFKYRSGTGSKSNKQTLHISKPWSPREKYEISKSRQSADDYEITSDKHRDRDERYEDRNVESQGFHEDKDSDRHRKRGSPYERQSTERRESDRYEGDEPAEERRIISVKKKEPVDNRKGFESGSKRSPRGENQLYSSTESFARRQKSADESISSEDYLERRSIVISNKTKRADITPLKQHGESEYISHVISIKPEERKRKSSHRYRSRSRSGSRYRSRSKSASRYRSRSRSRSRHRSRSRSRRRTRSGSRSRSSKYRYDRKSPDKYKDSESRSKDRYERSYDKEERRSSSNNRSFEGHYGVSVRRDVRAPDQYSPEHGRRIDEQQMSKLYQAGDADVEYSREIKIDKPRNYPDDTRQSARGEDDGRRQEKISKPNLSDIFADLPPPVMAKPKLNIAFASYVPRSVKLKQHQAPEASLNPESRPPPVSVQPVVPQNRDKNVTEIKDQVFKTMGSKYYSEDVDYSYRLSESESKSRKDHNRSGSHSRSRSPNEKSERSQKYKRRSRSESRSPEHRQFEEKSKKYKKYSRSRSRSPFLRRSELRIDRDDSGSRSHSRKKSQEQEKSDRRSQKHYKRSRSKSRSVDRKGKSPTRRSSKRSKSRSPSVNTTGRNVFVSKKGSKRSRSRSYDKYRKTSERSYERRTSRSRSRSYDDERKTIKLKEKSKKEPEVKKSSPVELPKVKSKWDSPEEKQSRWEETKPSANTLEMPLMLGNAQEKVNAIAASLMISKSPPPHRRMKPEEKKKLEEKWKELEREEQIDEVPGPGDSLVARKAVEAKVMEIEKQLMGDGSKSDGKKAGEKSRSSKKMKDHGLRSKWDSDSDSSTNSPRGQGRSSSSRSRSRSKERKTHRRSSEKKSPKSDSKGRHESLPDIVKSAKKDEQKVFWFHKAEVKKDLAKKKNKLQLYSSKSSKSGLPRKKRSRSRSPLFAKKGSSDDINKNPFKASSSQEISRSSGKGKSSEKPQDSLKEMEYFLEKLKSEKKKKEAGAALSKK